MIETNSPQEHAMTDFDPTETIKVGDLKPGDWLDSFPAQANTAALTVQSGVREITPSHRWCIQHRRRGAKFPIPASRVTFLMSAAVLDVPNDCTVTVRRQVAS